MTSHSEYREACQSAGLCKYVGKCNTTRCTLREAMGVHSLWLVPASILMRLGRLHYRMKFRVDAIVEREGSIDKAITSHGVGIGYLLAKEIADACWAASEVMEQVGVEEGLPEPSHGEHSSSSIADIVESYTDILSPETARKVASRIRAIPSSSPLDMERMREALRKMALTRHVRMAEGGGYVPSGGSCRLCSGEWEVGEPEKHMHACLAALSGSGKG